MSEQMTLSTGFNTNSYKPTKSVRPEGTKVTHEDVYVTPEIAREWLDAGAQVGEGQRNTRPKAVAKIARDMEAGNWHEDLGDPIRWDWHGRLRDGQHRLQAQLLAKKSYTYRVIRGLDPAEIKAVDTGTPRKFTDVLMMEGTKNSKNLAAITRRAILWDKGRRNPTGGTVEAPSHDEMADYLEANPELRMCAARANDIYVHGYRLIPPATGGFVYFLTARLDYEAAEDFWSKFQTHDNIGTEHPAMVLSRRLNTAKALNSRLNQAEITALCIRAWNLYREGKTAERLQLTRGGLTESNFPVPK